jgi:hypothetical protein
MKKNIIQGREIIKSVKFISIGSSRSANAGIEVVTDSAIYTVVTSTSQICCENHGYFASEDDLGEFVGAELLKIVATDDQLKTTQWPFVISPDSDPMQCVFFTFYTSVGPLQFVVYNQHNGYYGHSVKATRMSLDGNEEKLLDHLV